MADLAEEEAKARETNTKEEEKLKTAGKELPVTVKESGSGVSRDEVETSSSSILSHFYISFSFQHAQVGRKCVVEPIISGLLPTLAKGCPHYKVTTV